MFLGTIWLGAHLTDVLRLFSHTESPETFSNVPFRLLQQRFAGKERKAAVVQNDSPMCHGFGKLPSKLSLDDGHFSAGSREASN